MKKNVSFKALLAIAISCFSVNLFALISDNKKEPVTPYSEDLSSRYPTKVIFRPGIMPVGIFNVDTNVKLSALRNFSFNVGSKFGVLENLEGEFTYDGFSFEGFNSFKLKRTVNLGAKYGYFSMPHFAASAALNLPVHIGDGEIIQDFTLGLPIVVYNQVMAGGLLGNLMNLKMRPHIAMAFDFPWWCGVQVWGNLWAAFDGSFGSIEMVNQNNQAKWEVSGFWPLPSNLSLIYAFNSYIDLGANFGFTDPFRPKEGMNIGLNFSIRGGRLFG